MERDGGWHNYKGQIFFFKLDKKHTYPISLIEGAINFAEVEYHMGLYYKGTVQRGFENITMIRHRKFDNDNDKREFYRNIEELSGLENASSKLIVEDDWDDEREKTGNVRLDTIENEIKAEKYKHFEESASNYIRKGYKNIPQQLIDYIAGKLGNTTGEDLVKAQAIYSKSTAWDRKKLGRLFKELFWNYKEQINPSNDWSIKEYSLLDDGTVNQ